MKNKRHHQIIDGFRNHALAVEINNDLVELEKLEGDMGLAEAKGAIRQILREAERKKGLTRQANGTEDK